MLPEALFIYCNGDYSKIEGYEEAVNSPLIYDVHHKWETNPDRYYSKQELIAYDMYYKRPPEELQLIEHKAHIMLHIEFRRNHPELWENWTDKIREKNSSEKSIEKVKKRMAEYWTPERRKAKAEWRRNNPLTKEARKKISEANSGKIFSKEHCKNLSKAMKNSKRHKEVVHSENFINTCRQKSIEYWSDPKNREKAKLIKWWTNGVDSVHSIECPEGYWRGRTLKGKKNESNC